ncbi:MAG: ABC transporter ATP-binding protein [Deltaproteobacteria bacterium]|jgi:NitT/TauT family transport system ATP-binding protein|nr:ABC transporter ATP-binding protein [Deltaproteobacteria bacterium]
MAGVKVKVRGLAKSYGLTPIIEGLDLDLAPGESMALLGASGCGKTTALRILAGLELYDGGEVIVGTDKRGLEARSLVSQNLGLFPWKTVLGNLTLPLKLAQVDPIDAAQRVNKTLRELGLEGLASRYPQELSGGQRQRLALGRALVSQPELLLLDEPFSALDAMTRETLSLQLARLWRKLGLTMILATHSVEEAVFLGRVIVVLGGNPTKAVAVFQNSRTVEDASFWATDGFLDLVRKVRLALMATWETAPNRARGA